MNVSFLAWETTYTERALTRGIHAVDKECPGKMINFILTCVSDVLRHAGRDAEQTR